MIEAVIRLARSQKIERLLLDVADANTTAIALYSNAGFQATGKVSRFPPPREHITEREMELRLA